MYAILRFEKLKTAGAISASASHMMRTRTTHNADPAKRRLNRILAGSKDPSQDVDARLAAATQRRSNSVLALEVMASASPSWFEQASREQKADWMRTTKEWLVQQFGRENVASLHLHMDETTPHITGFIVPIDPASGRLNAARWVDGSAKLAQLQDGYAGALAHLGLRRGLEGSEAKHTSIKQFYGAMQAKDVEPVTAPRVDTPPIMVKESTRKEWAAGEADRIKKRQAPSINRARAQANVGLVAQRKASQYQATAEKFRAAAQAARDIPLQEVAERLGLARDEKDKSKWRDPQGIHAVSINGEKWFDHKAAVGRGGAIDLAMHVGGWDFKEAVAWLGHGVGLEKAAAAVTARARLKAEATVQQAMEEKPPFTPPAPSPHPGHLAKVKRYLVAQRGIDARAVNNLVDAGSIYADQRGNAVFPTRNSAGVIIGAELRGTTSTPFHGYAPGSSRDGCFEVQTGKEPKKLVLVESAIDALSYAQLHRQESLLVASTGGAKPSLPEAIEKKLNGFDEVVVAYDADTAGRTLGQSLMEALRALVARVRRQEPVQGKDWNDQLRTAANLSFSQEIQPPQAAKGPR